VKGKGWLLLPVVVGAAAAVWLNDREIRREAAFQARVSALSGVASRYAARRAEDRRTIDRLYHSVGSSRRVAVVAETLYVAIADTVRLALPDTLLPVFTRLGEAHRLQVGALNAAVDSALAAGQVSERGRQTADSIADAAMTLLRQVPKPVRWQAAVMLDTEGRVNVCAARTVGRIPLLRLPVTVGGCYRM